jgi:hypothetical protein
MLPCVCSTRVFRALNLDFATKVKCGFVREHETVLETIHLQPFLQIHAELCPVWSVGGFECLGRRLHNTLHTMFCGTLSSLLARYVDVTRTNVSHHFTVDGWPSFVSPIL